METIKAGTEHAAQITDLVRTTFAASEGAEEGDLIGALSASLMADTPPEDLYTFSAWEADTILGAVFFSRMRFAGDPRQVFILSPAAVATDRQGQGIGQRLMRHGLSALKAEGVDVALTYGDPNFYGNVGFQPITTDTVPAPHVLQFPHGWLGQSLTDGPLAPFKGPSTCVAALDNPALW